MLVAQTIARRSLCDRDKVGAVIVDARNRIVATGYNGPPAGFPRIHVGTCQQWCTRARAVKIIERTNDLPGFTIQADYSDCPSLHAEANALIVCDRSVREGGTIYVSSSICSACAKLIANSGLARVVIMCKSAQWEYRDSKKWVEFLKSCGLDVEVVISVES